MGLEDLRGTMAHDLCRMAAVCELDANRPEAARAAVEPFHRANGARRVEVMAYRDLHELLARRDIHAVLVVPPENRHATVAVDAVPGAKHVYVQKPNTCGIAKSIALRMAVRAKHRVLQTGSQQRSSRPWDTFRIASQPCATAVSAGCTRSESASVSTHRWVTRRRCDRERTVVTAL